MSVIAARFVIVIVFLLVLTWVSAIFGFESAALSGLALVLANQVMDD